MCDDLEVDEEDFQTVPLDDDHWTTEEIPDRHLCIHKHSLPHSLCSYPCPYMCHRHENGFGNEMMTFHTFSLNS